MLYYDYKIIDINIKQNKEYGMNIIIDERTESHMLCHNDDFFKGWKATFELLQEKGAFNDLKEPIERLEVALDEPIGYCTLVDTTDEDEIVYAKRLERELYTRFVKDREPSLIAHVVVILKKDEEVEDSYRLITMYPGRRSEKEPEDIKIESKEELIRSLNFWSKKALIYNEDIIEEGSQKDYCPYQNLYYIFD